MWKFFRIAGQLLSSSCERVQGTHFHPSPQSLQSVERKERGPYGVRDDERVECVALFTTISCLLSLDIRKKSVFQYRLKIFRQVVLSRLVKVFCPCLSSVPDNSLGTLSTPIVMCLDVESCPRNQFGTFGSIMKQSSPYLKVDKPRVFGHKLGDLLRQKNLEEK